MRNINYQLTGLKLKKDKALNSRAWAGYYLVFYILPPGNFKYLQQDRRKAHTQQHIK